METRKLGQTDMTLTIVGLGTWAMGGPWQFGWGPQDDTDAIDTVLAALDHGINWIDTAAVYGLGHSEELVGQALRRTSHKPYIATKCGLLWNEKREKVPCLEPGSIARECDASLDRLGIETIDLYQMHWPDPDAGIEAGWEAMARLVDQGKVRHIGVSNYSVKQLERVRKICPVASLQPPYSMLHRQVEDELLAYCSQRDIGVVAYSPMQRGLLTGRFNHKRLTELASDDHRLNHQDFQEPQFSATMALVNRLRIIADRNGGTCAQLAIRWVLRRPEVTAAIVGARRPEQIAETVQAANWDLARNDIEEIERLLADRENTIANT